jgi:hypothetical protein
MGINTCLLDTSIFWLSVEPPFKVVCVPMTLLNANLASMHYCCAFMDALYESDFSIDLSISVNTLCAHVHVTMQQQQQKQAAALSSQLV